MKEDNIFQLIRVMEQFNDKSIIQFTKTFEKDIGIAQILVLNMLAENDALKQTDISEKLGYSKGGVSHIVNKLIEKKYAERTYNKKDRRVILLKITSSGKEILQQAEQTGQTLRKNFLSVLNEEEVKQLKHITQKMLDAF